MTQAAPPPVDTRNPLVSAAGLTKVFKDFWMRDRVVAVDKIDFDVRPGEIFGLLGPNGSGKSTTIKLILGLLTPTAGRIRLFGREPEDVQVKRKIGYLPEESYLYRFLNARETLDFFGRLYYQSARERAKRIDTLLEMVGLQFAWRRPVGQYSKGMQRKIGLAQALINDPELLILDEPTTGMDPLGIRQTKELIVTLRKMGKTILLCSHQLAEIEDICDRVAIMYGGRIQALGTSEELLTVRDETVLRTDSLTEADIQAVDAFLTQRGTSLRSVEHPRKKLEVVFDKVIQDAQSGGLSTSGAVAGGAIPAFLLGQDTDPALTDDQRQTKQVLDALVSKPADPQPATDTQPQPVTDATSTPAQAPAPTEAEEAEQTLGQMGLISPTRTAPDSDSEKPGSGHTASETAPAPEPATEQPSDDVDLGVLSQLIQPESESALPETAQASKPSEAPPTHEASQSPAASQSDETAAPPHAASQTPSPQDDAVAAEDEAASLVSGQGSEGFPSLDEPTSTEEASGVQPGQEPERTPEATQPATEHPKQSDPADPAPSHNPEPANDPPQASEPGQPTEREHQAEAPSPDDAPASGSPDPDDQGREDRSPVIDALVIEPDTDSAAEQPSSPPPDEQAPEPPQPEPAPEADEQPESHPVPESEQGRETEADTAVPEEKPAEPPPQEPQAKRAEDQPPAKAKKPRAESPPPIAGGGLSGLYESVPPYQPTQADMDDDTDQDDDEADEKSGGRDSKDEVADSSFLKFLEEAQSDGEDPSSKRPKNPPGS